MCAYNCGESSNPVEVLNSEPEADSGSDQTTEYRDLVYFV